MSELSVVSMFTGAGGLDLGFEAVGFRHIEAVDLDEWSFKTLTHNRPRWAASNADVKEWSPHASEADVLLAGPPCQGFSLGGNRRAADDRNGLFREVVRVARDLRPRVVVIENVLNLRTMTDPETGRPFAEEIAHDLRGLGYEVQFDVFKMAHYGVPQTRRRFVFVGFRDGVPNGYSLPAPKGTEPIRPWIYDLAQGGGERLPNHNPEWGFRSRVHTATGEEFPEDEEVVPVRFSRTASDGIPLRNFDSPFPAIDTATIWGWAQGNVDVRRVPKDRVNGKFVRNPDASITLWRVSASRLRAFTHREYARLQTFPDDWEFLGSNLRDIHKQIGNAVPVEFARRLAENVKTAIFALDRGVPVDDNANRLTLF